MDCIWVDGCVEPPQWPIRGIDFDSNLLFQDDAHFHQDKIDESTCLWVVGLHFILTHAGCEGHAASWACF